MLSCARKVAEDKLESYAAATLARLDLYKSQRIALLTQSLSLNEQDRHTESLRSIEELRIHLEGLRRVNPRADLLWLACLEVEVQLKQEPAARSTVTLFGMRIIAEREQREAMRLAPTVENFSGGARDIRNQ